MSLDTLNAFLPGEILKQSFWGDRTMADPAWRAAFLIAPRYRFAPDTWHEWIDGAWVVRHRSEDPDGWAHAVYAVDQPLITQVDPDTGMPTCSLSAPIVVAAMLGALDLKPGMRVFESGAGTGWTAALMAEYVGAAGTVVSVEYDPMLAARAQRNADFTNAVIHNGDGTAGWQPSAPYDRVSATHAVFRIPRAWIYQTRPGGLVCAPLAVSESGLDLYVRLTVHDDGSASGPVLFPLAFMRSRTDAPADPAPWADDDDRPGTTDLDMPAIIADEHAWVLRLAIPGITITGPAVEDGDDCIWLSLPDGSWAVGYVPSGKPWVGATVEQHGPRDVWTEAEAAWARWQVAGSPGLDEYGLTVEADGTHRLWMREPGNAVTVLP